MRRSPKVREQQRTGIPEIISVQITMAGIHALTTWPPMEACAVIQYEWTRESSVFVIHGSLQNLYGEEAIIRLMVGRISSA
ncbi:hypothetical protein TNCV_1954561 [Trichonephila clavipes]|nr:hypothetical protein TNCV_1954561 [Trichonephila clavipes]